MLLSYIRTVVLYLVLVFVIRAMGKRQIGQMEPAEFVVTMLVANLASIPMQNGDIPLYSGLIPILTTLGVELLISWLTMKQIWARQLFCGKPVILIENGKILEENLRKTRVSLDELSGHLRQKDVLCFSDVRFAILETNGEMSVFPYARKKPATAEAAKIKVTSQELPITIIADGHLFAENLRLSGRDKAWLDGVLSQKKSRVSDTLLLTVDAAGTIFFAQKEG